MFKIIEQETITNVIPARFDKASRKYYYNFRAINDCFKINITIFDNDNIVAVIDLNGFDINKNFNEVYDAFKKTAENGILFINGNYAGKTLIWKE